MEWPPSGAVRNGGLGWLFIVKKWIIPPFPTSTSKITYLYIYTHNHTYLVLYVDVYVFVYVYVCVVYIYLYICIYFIHTFIAPIQSEARVMAWWKAVFAKNYLEQRWSLVRPCGLELDSVGLTGRWLGYTMWGPHGPTSYK